MSPKKPDWRTKLDAWEPQPLDDEFKKKFQAYCPSPSQKKDFVEALYYSTIAAMSQLNFMDADTSEKGALKEIYKASSALRSALQNIRVARNAMSDFSLPAVRALDGVDSPESLLPKSLDSGIKTVIDSLDKVEVAIKQQPKAKRPEQRRSEIAHHLASTIIVNLKPFGFRATSTIAPPKGAVNLLHEIGCHIGLELGVLAWSRTVKQVLKDQE